MKRVITAIVLLAAITTAAHAAKPATEIITTERQLVGWTGTPFAGTTGLLTLIQACGSAFPGSTVQQALTLPTPQHRWSCRLVKHGCGPSLWWRCLSAL